MPRHRQPDLFQAIALLCFYLSFAAVGWFIPEFMRTNLEGNVGPGWLAKTSQVIGALGGLYIGIRGAVVWAGLMIIGMLTFAVLAIGSHILGA